VRTKQLIALGLIEHHLLRGTGKRREWYTLTEKGKRVLKAIIELEKAFQGKGKSDG
jgi:DNA-binding PadR family transcriptional regulator